MKTSLFNEWLKRRIEDLGLTQAEFADRAGVATSTLGLWLSETPPRIRGLNRSRLAKALGVTRNQIDSRLDATHRVAATN
jgi:predicted transcriptional regulator